MTIPLLEFWVPTITVIWTKEENRSVKIVEGLLVCLNLFLSWWILEFPKQLFAVL